MPWNVSLNYIFTNCTEEFCAVNRIATWNANAKHKVKSRHEKWGWGKLKKQTFFEVLHPRRRRIRVTGEKNCTLNEFLVGRFLFFFSSCIKEKCVHFTDWKNHLLMRHILAVDMAKTFAFRRTAHHTAYSIKIWNVVNGNVNGEC